MPFSRTWTSPSFAAPLFVILWLVGYHLWGNAALGYGHGTSLWQWWVAPWFDAQAELEHGPLVVLGAIALAWRLGKEAMPSPARLPWLVLLLAFAAVFHFVGLRAQLPRLSFFSVMLILLAVAEWSGGRERAKSAVPALVLLAFSLYWGFLDSFGVGVGIRKVLAEVAAFFLGFLGYAIEVQGTQLIPLGGGKPFEIAAACSGVRTFTALVALTFWWAHWSPPYRRRRWLLIAFACALVWLGNGVRIVAAVLAPETLATGAWHEVWGTSIFLIELVLVIEFGRRFCRVPSAESPVASSPARLLPDDRRRGFVVVGGFLVSHLTLAWWAHEAPGPTVAASTPTLPVWTAGGWYGQTAPLSAIEEATFPAETRWDRRIYRKLPESGGPLLVTCVQAGRDRTSIHRPELCLSGLGWEVVDRRVVSLGTHLPWRATELRLSRRDGKQALMLYWFAKGSRTEPTYGSMILAWIAALFTEAGGERWRYWSIQTLTEIGQTEGAREEATRLATELWETQIAHEKG